MRSLIGVDSSYDQLADALAQHTIIILIAPPKSGKSTICKELFQELQYNLIQVNYTDLHSHKEFQALLSKAVATRSIMEMINGIQKVVFFDDIDALAVQDRYAIGYMYTYLSTLDLRISKTKVVITCSRTEERRVSELQKLAHTVHMATPSADSLFDHFTKKENYKVTKKKFAQMATALKLNFSHIKAELDSSYESTELQDYCDTTLYELVQSLLQKNHFSDKEYDQIMNQEHGIITLMLYDNIANRLALSKMHQLLQNYILSTILEEYAYKAVDWDLLEITSIVRVGAISAALKDAKRSDKKPAFTQIPSRCAQFYLNTKKSARICDQEGIDYLSLLALAQALHDKTIKFPARSEMQSCCNLIIRNLGGKLFL